MAVRGLDTLVYELVLRVAQPGEGRGQVRAQVNTTTSWSSDGVELEGSNGLTLLSTS